VPEVRTDDPTADDSHHHDNEKAHENGAGFQL
jgi:hypothetical protein